ncbi:unnamed protein product [Lactuca saligna]|uniref:Uncharacterized protein n=1 Tax=Lactuca saligna TaxID=75948 RepID=A0AA35YWD1_LACSI|nr:unnamed protein product [Lactuca saligna]
MPVINVVEGMKVDLVALKTEVENAKKDMEQMKKEKYFDTIAMKEKIYKFTGQHFRKLFWKAVNACFEQKFRRVMEKIKSVDTHAYDYLIDRDPTTWSNAFFKREEIVMQLKMGCVRVSVMLLGMLEGNQPSLCYRIFGYL